MGLSDVANVKPVKLYCARCEDLYNPKSSRHASIDGAYFGTSFHNILFQVYPALIPLKTMQRHVPRLYGFGLHASAALVRWQHARRDEMRRRLKKLDMDAGFGEENGIEDEDEDEDEEEEDDDDAAAAAAAAASAPIGSGTGHVGDNADHQDVDLDLDGGAGGA